jgi:membrane protein required for colicin V production
LFFAGKVGIIKPQTFAGSTFYGFIQPWGPAAINGFGKVIPLFKDLFTQLEGFFEGLAK